MEIFEFKFKPTLKVRHYKVDAITDIAYLYEQNELSYRQAVRQVKLHCSLNAGLAERRLYAALTKRGIRLPMVKTRLIKEVVASPEREQSTLEQVKDLFKQAKYLRR